MQTFDAYHHWLGLPPGLEKPTYYELLGVAPEQADPATIRRHVVDRIRKLHEASAGKELLGKELIKRVRRAEKTLLNSRQRTAYDARLKSRGQPLNSIAAEAAEFPRLPNLAHDLPLSWGSTQVTEADLDPLAPFLPPGLYSSPETLMHYVAPARATLVATHRHPVSPVGLAPTAAVAAEVPSAAPVAMAMATADIAPIANVEPPIGSDASDSAPRRSQAKLYGVAAMRKQAASGWGVLLLCLMGVIGVVAAIYIVQSTHRPVAMNEPVAPHSDSNDQQVAEILDPNDRTPSRRTGRQGEADPPTSASGSPPSAEELRQLGGLLEDGFLTLREYDFARHQEIMTQAAVLARTGEHQAMVQRQQDLARHVRRFQELLVGKLREAPAGTIFSVSETTQFGLVEVRPDEVVLRIQGANRRYSLTPLPRGVGVGLAQSILDNSPGSQVLIGAFLAAHPDRDAQDVEKARARWQSAVEAGLELDGLPQVLDDDYQILGE